MNSFKIEHVQRKSSSEKKTQMEIFLTIRIFKFNLQTFFLHIKQQWYMNSIICWTIMRRRMRDSGKNWQRGDKYFHLSNDILFMWFYLLERKRGDSSDIGLEGYR